MATFKSKIKDCFVTFDKKFLITLETSYNSLTEDTIYEYSKGEIDKTEYSVTIEKYREPRSLNANAYFHVLVNKIAEKMQIGNDECKIQMNLEYGTPATDKNGNTVIVKLASSVDIKQFYDYAKLYATKQEDKTEVNYYILYKQTHTLDSKQMARLIDGVVFEAKELGIEVKTPKEIEEMKRLWESNCV